MLEFTIRAVIKAALSVKLKGRFVEEGYFPVLSELEFQTNLTRIQVLKITGT